MEIRTHQRIAPELCGKALVVEEGRSEVVLQTSRRMAADSTGLVHGGFVFGLADYAAMIAVNHPNVVLGGATVRFLKPVRVGDEITARARVNLAEGKKREVLVSVEKNGEVVFEGSFTCFVPDRHVLARRED